MPLSKLQLRDGTLIEWISCYFTETYDGLSGGAPCPVVNQWVIDGIQAKAKSLWPDYPIVMIPPQITKSGNIEHFPPVAAIAFLRGVNDHQPNMRSYLVIIYFQHDLQYAIDRENAERFSSVDWQTTAFYRQIGL